MPDDRVNTTSHHEVRLWIKDSAKAGFFKRCIYLKNIPSYSTDGRKHFIPNCERDSFDWHRWNRERLGGYDKRSLLQEYLNNDLISCPKNCVNYHSVRRENIFIALNNGWKRTRHYVLVPFRWFDRQPVAVKVLILALLIVVVIPIKWVSQLMQLLQAIHGLAK